jgi:hypothetical protein
VKEV